MNTELWKKAFALLEQQISDLERQQWISPLQIDVRAEKIIIWAPNQYVLDGLNSLFLGRLVENYQALTQDERPPRIILQVGTSPRSATKRFIGVDDEPSPVQDSVRVIAGAARQTASPTPNMRTPSSQTVRQSHVKHENNLNPNFVFERFVVGKANQLAQAAAQQVAENFGRTYNPVLFYGPVGLGKTHLMHAVGNHIMQQQSRVYPGKRARVLYLRSEQFVDDMVMALQRNAIKEFKEYYRSVDALLIDDIQLFAGKERTQEEFFHTFNALLEGQQQIILTSDRFPKDINGLEERLRSRFGAGLTVAVEPPELETRVAILMSKAEHLHFKLPPDVAFFIAKCVRSNVRELEGALKRVIANAQLTGSDVTLMFAKESLKDLIASQERQISTQNILKTISQYFRVPVVDLVGKSRARPVVRPRQIAMALCKELTELSLLEIGEAFGGRDHTTVLHGIQTIERLRKTEKQLAEDYDLMVRTLTT